jgi:L-ascorbate metabolism protein UlaG (beta-lactamase superfamily)
LSIDTARKGGNCRRQETNLIRLPALDPLQVLFIRLELQPGLKMSMPDLKRTCLSPAGCRPPAAETAHRLEPSAWPERGLTVAWLGHSSVLLRLDGFWLLLDPALRDRIGIRVGPLTVGPRRLRRPAIETRDLPRLDAILISHAHMDHLDLGTLRRLPRETAIVAAQGTRDLLRRFPSVSELAWGEAATIGPLRIEAIPARHWGARTITDRHRGYGGFLIEGSRRVVYTGDTAFHTGYDFLRERGPVDLAILPIGAYDPWIDNHANPEESWAMGRQMDATHILPVHHQTFRLSREPEHEPLERLVRVAGEERWRIAATALGETWHAPA